MPRHLPAPLLASLLWAALSVVGHRAHAASLGAASDAEKAQAAEQYMAGVEAFQAGRLDEALSAFARSYELVESPNSHLMVGKTLLLQNRPLEAHRAFEATASEADRAAAADPKYADTAAAARAELAATREKLGSLELVLDGASDQAKVVVDGQTYTLGELPAPLLVQPGEVAVEWYEGAELQARSSVHVSAGQARSLSLQRPRAEPEGESPVASGPYPDREALVYVSGGIGVLGLASFGIFGLLNHSQYDELDDACSGGVCPGSRRQDAVRGHRYQTIANIGLLVGVVGIGTGLGLYFVDEGPENGRQASTQVGLGLGSVVVKGSF